MPELPYPPAPRPDAAEHAHQRVLGGVLTFLSILLALLGCIFHQRVPDLLLAISVGIVALRVLLLWLGAQPQHHQPLVDWSSREWERSPWPSPPSPAGPPASSASPDAPTQPLSQLAPEQPMPQSVPLPHAAVAPLAPQVPRSIRPPRPLQAAAFPAQPAPPPQGVQPLSPAPLPSLWPPPPSASVSLPVPAPVPRPSQQEHWQYDDGKHGTQQEGNDHGTA